MPNPRSADLIEHIVADSIVTDILQKLPTRHRCNCRGLIAAEPVCEECKATGISDENRYGLLKTQESARRQVPCRSVPIGRVAHEIARAAGLLRETQCAARLPAHLAD